VLVSPGDREDDKPAHYRETLRLPPSAKSRKTNRLAAGRSFGEGQGPSAYLDFVTTTASSVEELT